MKNSTELRKHAAKPPSVQANFKPTKLGTRGKVFRDPVHGLVRLGKDDGVLLDLINTPEMQRLRRIRQLGVSWMTYHGAEHSRFVHSLGVTNFARRLLETIERRHGDNLDVSKQLKKYSRTIKAAAILHDVGHGPFSHMVERAFDTKKHHEAKTAEIITSSDYSVASILEAHGLDPKKVQSVIDGTFECWWLKDIVSSQLDADRMDYLLRDSLMTGVEYGRYDAEWIINNVCLAYDPNPNVKAQGPNHWRLCLDSSRGLCSAEQLIVARMHMSMQVYYHRVTRSWEAHLLCLFGEATDLAAENGLPANTPGVLAEYFRKKGNVGADAFLQLDEALFFTGFQAWSRATGKKAARLARLAECFVKRKKVFYHAELPKDTADVLTLHNELEKAGRQNREWLLDDNRFVGYKDFGSLYLSKKGEPGEISSTAILLSKGDLKSRAIPAEDVDRSVLLPAIGREELPISWLYFDGGLRDKVEKIIRKS